MKNGSSAAATKRDLHALEKRMDRRFRNAESQLKDHLLAFEDRITRHFDVVAEQHFHDLCGANRDEIELIKDRVTRLERHTRLIRA